MLARTEWLDRQPAPQTTHYAPSRTDWKLVGVAGVLAVLFHVFVLNPFFAHGMQDSVMKKVAYMESH